MALVAETGPVHLRVFRWSQFFLLPTFYFVQERQKKWSGLKWGGRGGVVFGRDGPRTKVQASPKQSTAATGGREDILKRSLRVDQVIPTCQDPCSPPSGRQPTQKDQKGDNTVFFFFFFLSAIRCCRGMPLQVSRSMDPQSTVGHLSDRHHNGLKNGLIMIEMIYPRLPQGQAFPVVDLFPQSYQPLSGSGRAVLNRKCL